MKETDISSLVCTIAPWLSVRNGARAVEFYKSAFQAKEVYHIEDQSGAIVSRLAVGGAEFWVSQDIGVEKCKAVRMILTVQSPDLVFQQALAAGASVVFPVQDAHGWRVGRLVDPFGFHWEIGFQYKE